MRKRRVIGATWSAVALVGLIAACDDPQSNLPTSPSVPTISTLGLSGPASLAPGESAQFSAVIAFGDGTTKAVMSAPSLRWRTSNSSILQVTSSGVVTATQQRGDATVSADWTSPSRTSTREVVVLPPGTFRVVGQVTETDVPTAVISGARVEALPDGIVATTDAVGQYRLYGVSPDATIRVTADGYFPSETPVRLTGHAVLNVQLALSGPRLTLAGPYTLALELIGGCPTQRPLPVELRSRTYDAAVTQTGSQVDVLLTEPRFRLNSIGRGNRFTGRATASGVVFTLEGFFDYYYPYYGPTSYPNVAERLSDGTHFIPAGAVVTTGSATGLSGQIGNAFFSQYSSAFPFGTFLTSCSAPVQFTLTRR